MNVGLIGQATGRGGSHIHVVVGQYIGFAAILAAPVVRAFGAGLLPETALPYLSRAGHGSPRDACGEGR